MQLEFQTFGRPERIENIEMNIGNELLYRNDKMLISFLAFSNPFPSDQRRSDFVFS